MGYRIKVTQEDLDELSRWERELSIRLFQRGRDPEDFRCSCCGVIHPCSIYDSELENEEEGGVSDGTTG